MPLTRLKSPDAAARWLREWVTGTLRTDSRQVQPGDAFIAWPGHATDGRQYARTALAGGATTCLVEHEGVSTYAFDNARIASLPRLKAATGAIADAFFGQPSAALQVVATTGTNGKTSTAWWTAQALSMLGRRCGVVGTLGIGEPPRHGAPAGDAGTIEFTGLTTPDPVRLQAALRGFVDAGFAACAIEASSIGLVEHRLAGTRIAVALFTNFTQDHLDFHGNMAAYWQAKRALFDWPALRAAVVNVDDEHGAAMAVELLREGRLDVWTYSTRAQPHGDTTPRLHASTLGYADGGLAFDLHESSQAAGLPLRSTLIGDYNASNLLAVLGGLRALGVPLADAVGTVPYLTPVPGRMQRVRGATAPGTGPAEVNAGPAAARLPEVVVDYAHSPDALDKALQALRPLAAARGGRLVCVFGCGGNRDATKRPTMGAIAEALADRVVLTSDNPRHEVPGEILRQIAAGLARPAEATLVEDRRAAIALAIGDAAAADVVLIAGKGHEDYQEVAGVKQPFSDVDEAARVLRQRSGASE